MVKFFCLCNFSSASFIVAVELDSGSIVFDCIIRMTCVSSHHCECCKVARAKSHSQKLQRILSQEWETAAEPGNLPSLPPSATPSEGQGPAPCSEGNSLLICLWSLKHWRSSLRWLPCPACYCLACFLICCCVAAFARWLQLHHVLCWADLVKMFFRSYKGERKLQFQKCMWMWILWDRGKLL